MLAGGALASGLRARIGSNIPTFRPAWYVKRGTSAERVKVTCGFTFVGVSRDQLFSIVVDDFAEGVDLITCPADFHLEGDGQFAEYNSNLGFTIPVRKAGEGTWFVGASSANYHAAIRIEQGEMIFGVDNGFPNAELISLEGGCLNAASATTQTFQKLKVTKDSTLVIGEGANVQFAAVDAADWTGRLAITGDFRDVSPLRIGTAKVLTAQQLGNIRINNRRAVQDDNGYMHPYYGGPVIIVR